MSTNFIAAILIGAITATVAALGALGGVVAQTDLGAAGNTGLLITGGSASASAAALAYVVRQIVSGRLVHRDVAEAEEANRRIAEAAQSQAQTYANFIERRLDGG